MGSLNEADKLIIPLATREAGRFDLFCQWYLRGWKPLKWQYKWHQVDVHNTTVIAGIACGKTTITTASNLADCLSTPYFRALNTSVTAKQAQLAFDMAFGWIDGNGRLEHLIYDVVLRPYPIIKFYNGSQYEFRTAGTDARYIRGSEYDRIGLDECGLDVQGGIVKVLRGRLRGTRPGRRGIWVHRTARLDLMGSPVDSLWLRERFMKGDPESDMFDPDYVSFCITTWDNTYLSREQLLAMEKEFPPDMLDVEMGGNFPSYGGGMFPSSHLALCQSIPLYDEAYSATSRKVPKTGYIIEEDNRWGILRFEMPRDPSHVYVVGGDPGTGSVPQRNAGVVIAEDISLDPAQVVYFHWITGKGAYEPFLNSMRYAITKYQPGLKGFDATGTQKMMDELAFEKAGIDVEALNFGSDKLGMLNALSLDVTGHHVCWPPISGLHRQMRSYVPEEDNKIAQDIVMALAVASHLKRFLKPVELPSENSMEATVRRMRFGRSRIYSRNPRRR